MSNVKFKGSPVSLAGNFVNKGETAKPFVLTDSELSEQNLENYKGKKKLLNIFPSLDTDVCATSVRKFNEKAGKFDNSVVLCISKDLPFAHKRFCSTEGIENVVTLSDHKCTSFGSDYGILINDSPLSGLFARAVVVIDENDKIVYTELVDDIAQEPDYDKAIEALK